MGALAISGGKVVTRGGVPCIGCCDGEPSIDCNLSPVPCSTCGMDQKLMFRLYGQRLQITSTSTILVVDVTAMTSFFTPVGCSWSVVELDVGDIVFGGTNYQIRAAIEVLRTCLTCDDVNYFWAWQAFVTFVVDGLGQTQFPTASTRTYDVNEVALCPAQAYYFGYPPCPPLTFPCMRGTNPAGFGNPLRLVAGGPCDIWGGTILEAGNMELLA